MVEDLPGVLAIQADVLPQSGWSGGDYERLHASPHGLILIAESEVHDADGVIVGFSATRSLGEDAELLALAVATPCQRQGVGRSLLRETCTLLKKRGSRRVYLEVRASNCTAIELYRKAGFTFHSVRKDYYNHPREDAWIMESALLPAHPLVLH